LSLEANFLSASLRAIDMFPRGLLAADFLRPPKVPLETGIVAEAEEEEGAA